MKYKRLGDYIREVNVRNRDLKVTETLGLIARVGSNKTGHWEIAENGQYCNSATLDEIEKI